MRSLLLLLALHSARAADDAEMAALRAAKTELQDTVAEDERYDALLRRQEELYKRTGSTVETMHVSLRVAGTMKRSLLEERWQLELASVCGAGDEKCKVGAGAEPVAGPGAKPGGATEGDLVVKVFDADESTADALQKFFMAQAETVTVRWKDKTQRSPAEKKRMAQEAREKVRRMRQEL